MNKIETLENQLKDFKEQCFAGEEAKRISSIYNTVVSDTRLFVKNAGFKDVVLGLSGGIDSAVVACIAVDALGNSHVHAIILPGPYTSQSSWADAKLLAKNLDIDLNTVFIDGSYQKVVETLSKSGIYNKVSTNSDLTNQNIQARLRMIMIMAASNENSWMMLNTANKSEVYTGYSTLYGDMAGAFSPLGNVYKCDVFKMAVYKNLATQRKLNNDFEVVPQSIVSRPPSAELTSNQTDESSLGVDYPSLDAIISLHVDEGLKFEEIISKGFSSYKVQKVIQLIKKSEFKRRYEPPAALS